MRPGRQQPTAVLAALGLLAFGFLPAEHVHVAQDHDGHHADVVHRHFEPHHQRGTHAAIDDDEDGPDVQWLTTTFTGPQGGGHVGPDTHAVGYDASIAQPEVTSRTTSQPLFVSVHDPPWASASGLRAPPPSRL